MASAGGQSAGTAPDDRGWHVVVLSGQLGRAAARTLRQELADLAFTGNTRITVDLRDVDHIELVALAVLVREQRLLERLGGALSLVCREGVVRTALRASGLDHHFAIHADLAAALSARPAPSARFRRRPA